MLIEIYSDLVCPWCFIGKARLERALRERPGLAVDLRWVPFALNPDFPPDGMDRATYLILKFGGVERARDVHAVIEQAALRDGLPLRLDLIERTPNTRDAHRLVRFAERYGVATAMTDRLFSAYFQQGRDIGDPGVLLTIATEAGLPFEATADYLDSEADKSAIRAGENQARQLGIQAIPCFVFDRRYVLAGAQEWTAFLPLLDLGRDNA